MAAHRLRAGQRAERQLEQVPERLQDSRWTLS